jgi:hypothetical protein
MRRGDVLAAQGRLEILKRLDTMKHLLVSIILASGFLFVTAPSQAETLSFAAQDGNSYSAATSFTANDFTFNYAPASGGFGKVGNPVVCSPACSSNGVDAFYSFNTGSLGFAATSGSAFTLNSLDLAQTFTTLSRPLDVLVTGTLEGGGTVTEAFTSAAGTADSFQLFTLSSAFTNLASVTINGVGSYPTTEFAVDNITVATAPVPLPASVWLMLSGLVGVGAMSRKRRAFRKAEF